MVVLRKRLPEEKYKRLAEKYMPRQKYEGIRRTMLEQSYTWIMEIGEENRDSDDETREQTKER